MKPGRSAVLRSRCSEELKARVLEWCAANESDESELVRRAVVDFLTEHEAKPNANLAELAAALHDADLNSNARALADQAADDALRAAQQAKPPSAKGLYSKPRARRRSTA